MPGLLSSPYSLAVVLALTSPGPALGSDTVRPSGAHVELELPRAQATGARTPHHAPAQKGRARSAQTAIADGRGRTLGLIMGMLIGVGLWLTRRRLGD